MKRTFLLVALASLLVAEPASGQTVTPDDPDAGLPITGRITVTGDECVRLTRHVPDADVTYQPGKDDVVPADVDGLAPVAAPKDFSIYIGVDTHQHLAVPSDGGFYKGYVDAGRVDYRDGQLFYNGRPLTPPEEEQVRYLCSKALSE